MIKFWKWYCSNFKDIFKAMKYALVWGTTLTLLIIIVVVGTVIACYYNYYWIIPISVFIFSLIISFTIYYFGKH